MDLNSLKDQVSNLTLYDIKAGVRKVQNGMSLQLRALENLDSWDCSGDELHRDGGEGQLGIQTFRIFSDLF
jgi:epsin